jgi:hypothetical protein
MIPINVSFTISGSNIFGLSDLDKRFIPFVELAAFKIKLGKKQTLEFRSIKDFIFTVQNYIHALKTAPPNNSLGR